MLDLPEVARRLLAEAGVETVESSDLCTCCESELFFSHRRDRRHDRPPGGRWSGSTPMAEPITGIDPAVVRRNLERVRERCGDGVEVLAASKYVLAEEMRALAEAGVELVGENRLQDMEAKHERFGDRFQWDFIGNIQSRKVKRILALARLIHSVATESVLDQLERHGGAETEILVEVNLAGEASKGWRRA